jgi:hypothetical protein
MTEYSGFMILVYPSLLFYFGEEAFCDAISSYTSRECSWPNRNIFPEMRRTTKDLIADN